MPNLKGRVAVVTGSGRGAGRGIALALGESGATVYVTGRSVKGQPTTDNMPGAIDETAEAVTARGGVGVAARYRPNTSAAPSPRSPRILT